LKSANRLAMYYFGNWSNPRSTSPCKLSFVSPLASSVGACTFRTITSHQRPLSVIYDICH
jgi:hypothetical protein